MNATRTETTQYEIYEVKTDRGQFFLSRQVKRDGFSKNFMVVSGRTMHPSRIKGVDWFVKIDDKFIPEKESLRTFEITISN